MEKFLLKSICKIKKFSLHTLSFIKINAGIVIIKHYSECEFFYNSLKKTLSLCNFKITKLQNSIFPGF